MSDDQHEILLDLTQPTDLDRVPVEGVLAGKVGDDRVLVWSDGKSVKAYGATCPHLGAPLDTGIVTEGTIRCPWHHACFNLATGEATAAPAFDDLTKYSVTLDGDRFCVTAPCAQEPRVTPPRQPALGTMAIVGGGAAGFAAADALAKLGWPGEITLFSDEASEPYDRTLLTKDYLDGAFGDDRLPIAQHSLADLGVKFERHVRVERIDPEHKRLRLANGEARSYTKLLLATGAAPRRSDIPGAGLPHVMVLRSLEDCQRVLFNVAPRTRIAIVGGSFIAMEAAA